MPGRDAHIAPPDLCASVRGPGEDTGTASATSYEAHDGGHATSHRTDVIDTSDPKSHEEFLSIGLPGIDMFEDDDEQLTGQ